MKSLTIYIASSWKNQHAVELLTDRLEALGHVVKSFVRESTDLEGIANAGGLDAWINSKDGRQKFYFDTDGATESDLVVYIGPSGTDAWAEVGAAWASGVEVLGLWAKGEGAGLMRRMVTEWFGNYRDLLAAIGERAETNAKDR
ncbi:MAG TPA: hypothetical protein P5142_00210 [Spirochaetia bacterium]|nr:hypothetical protein [Spirochaetia bacterium]